MNLLEKLYPASKIRFYTLCIILCTVLNLRLIANETCLLTFVLKQTPCSFGKILVSISQKDENWVLNSTWKITNFQTQEKLKESLFRIFLFLFQILVLNWGKILKKICLDGSEYDFKERQDIQIQIIHRERVAGVALAKVELHLGWACKVRPG